jgi:hypothetical protein
VHLIARIARRAAAGARGEEGFTFIAIVGLLAAAMALSVAAFAAAGGDIHLSRNDEDQKRAYAAAEAGVQDYFFHLTQDNAYWAKCDSAAAANAALNQAGSGPATALRQRRVPDSTASYAIELLPANGRTSCDTRDPEASMIVSSGMQSGTFRIRSTGFSGDVRRSIVASFRRRSFLDYLYFTDYETADPVWYTLSSDGRATRSGNWTGSRSGGRYDWRDPATSSLLTWAASSCPVYWRNNRRGQVYPPSDAYWQKLGTSDWDASTISSSRVPCTEIQFADGDAINGPLHTNDDILICGQPTFGRRDKEDTIEVSGSGWRNGCDSRPPDMKGIWKPYAPVLTAPPSSTKLREIADPAYRFAGRTTIVLAGQSMVVTNTAAGMNRTTVPLPANGVVYVDNSTATGCSVLAYQALDPYGAEATARDPRALDGCADVELSGSYSRDLTIASAKDIVIVGDVTKSDGEEPLLGLIANNFVRVRHPVTRSASDPSSCTNATGTMQNVRIDAAILALNHSFTVDNYYCGAPLGRLTVNGTIAQKYRGPVGRGSGTSRANGYLKDYWYNDRLRLREPPHFLDPVQSSWRIQRYAEQVPAR